MEELLCPNIFIFPTLTPLFLCRRPVSPSCFDSFRPQSSGSMLRKLTSRAFGEPSDTTILPPVILCIGTDRLIGDSLGPLTGSLLQRAHCPLPVYGTLAQPVHALNLADFLAEIRRTHSNSPVIAIDASLGPDSRIGCLTLRPHGLQPGAGVHKRLAPAGDISITGITGPNSRQPYLSLQTARLATVMEMAEEICACILQVGKTDTTTS